MGGISAGRGGGEAKYSFSGPKCPPRVVNQGTKPGLPLGLHNGSPVYPWDNPGDEGRQKKFTPPLQKYYRQLFLFVELISLGLPGKSVTWFLEIISGELIPWDYRTVWPGLSTV